MLSPRHTPVYTDITTLSESKVLSDLLLSNSKNKIECSNDEGETETNNGGGRETKQSYWNTSQPTRKRKKQPLIQIVYTQQSLVKAMRAEFPTRKQCPEGVATKWIRNSEVRKLCTKYENFAPNVYQSKTLV